MRRYFTLFAIAALILLATSARADILYSDGAIGQFGGEIYGGQWISAGYTSSDSFVLTSDSIVTDLSNIGILVGSGDTVSDPHAQLVTLTWIISTAPGGGGVVEASGINVSPSGATPLNLTYQSGYMDTYNVNFTVDNLTLGAGMYYLTLTDGIGTVTYPADFVAWDQNNGPSLDTNYFEGVFYDTRPGESFEIDGIALPEPNGICLLAIGILMLIAVKLRRSAT